MCMKMRSAMGCGVTSLLIWMFFIESAVALQVSVLEKWQEGEGWTAVCEWRFPKTDRLQSVRLYFNDSQFFMYRPEVHGMVLTYNALVLEYNLEATCMQPAQLPGAGKCVLELRPLQPPTSPARIHCEVSGEKPTFYVQKKDLTIHPFVGPSKAQISVVPPSGESPRLTLNCSSSGLPAPKLEWTVGNQQIPADFSDATWNATSKQFDAWSSLSPLETGRVECLPQGRYRGRVSYGPSAYYSSAHTLGGDVIRLVALSTLVTLLR